MKNRRKTGLLKGMKIRLFFVFCFLLALLIGGRRGFIAYTPVLAESNQSYNQFIADYRQYQNLLSPFNVSRSKYLTYKSVIAQGDFLDAAKKLIGSEIASINSFTQFLINYLNEANQSIGLSENVVLIKLSDLQNRIVALSERQNLIDSLESAQTIMIEVDDLYGEMYRLSYWAKATVESAGIKKIYDNLGIVNPKLAEYLSTLPVIYRENQAANEKFRNMEITYNLIAETISGAYSAQVGFDNPKSNPPETEKAIHKQIQKATDAIYNLIIGYQNILFAVKK